MREVALHHVMNDALSHLAMHHNAMQYNAMRSTHAVAKPDMQVHSYIHSAHCVTQVSVTPHPPTCEVHSLILQHHTLAPLEGLQVERVMYECHQETKFD
jgi:hypothetical protein